MKKLLSIGVILASALTASCGGGGDNTLSNPGGGGGTVEVAIVELLTSSPQIASDLAQNNSVTLTAVIKDADNAILTDVPVTFSADSGALTVTRSKTDESGTAEATLTNGSDVANRPITVTARADGITGTVTVNVSGTTLTVTPASASLGLGAAATFSVLVKDSTGAGVPNAVVDVSSANGNTLSSSTLTTGVSGDASFDLTADNSGDDTVGVTALGITRQASITVSGDDFVFTAPAQNAEIALGADRTVTARWRIDGNPVADGTVINFSSTRGTLSASSAVTVNGEASVTVSSDNAGPAVITATAQGGLSTSRQVEFVATNAETLDLQAEPFTVRSGEQSTITAIVRDPDGNLVKNKVVAFELTDITNGFLSVASATTDSQGRAATIYTGGSVTSPVDGVSIRAFVQSEPAVEDTVQLTVAGQALAISLGTGNALFEIGTAVFAKEWAIFVTDADGNPVNNKTVQVAIRSVNYKKGQLGIVSIGGDEVWAKVVEAVCADEDVNLNGILDDGEDLNSSNLLEAGNIALVAAVPADASVDDPCGDAGTQGQSATVVTNSVGQARVCVFYPQNYNLWLDARISAKASVQGTEFSKSQTFELEALANDLNNTNASPPGVVSPFGPEPDCSIAPPP